MASKVSQHPLIGAVRERLLAGGKAFVLGVGAQVTGTVFFVLTILSLALFTIGVGIFMLPAVTLAARSTANVYRRLTLEWTGVEIAEPYRPEPPDLDYGVIGTWRRCKWIITDPATWRDFGWLTYSMTFGLPLGILALAFVGEGIYGWVLAAGVWRPIASAGGDWYTFIHVTDQTTALLAGAWGTVLIPIGLLTAPLLLKLQAQVAHSMLSPTASAERIRHLTETRHETIDTQATELRRIERDLHDGAQARLVAMGMTLGAAEHLIERDPDAARTLLAEARQASHTALSELRDLVRGIHPPVLSDRGLVDAIQALGLDSQLRVTVSSTLDGRPEPPVESAAYFAVSELLANAAKHSGAERVWIDIEHRNGVLRIKVTDDGRGGADLDAGTGLRGIERRLAAFDGVLVVNSPVGGPTVIGIGLPCTLSEAQAR